MIPLNITAHTTVSAAGHGGSELFDALVEGRSGLRKNDFPHAAIDTWIGRVEGLEQAALEGDWREYDCRNNRLAEMALQQDDFLAAVAGLKQRIASERIGLFIGSSTSGILSTELAYRRRDEHGTLPADYHYRGTHDLYSVTGYLRRRLGLEGPAFTVSTACSSSAKVFADAQRHIAAGLCDAAFVGGVDSLCLTTLYGFHSLELVSEHPCRPCDRARDGINIGEAAGFAIVEKQGADSAGPVLLGYGESSDAYHMSTPHPQGAGAALAMNTALQRAGLTPGQIDYINMHGTATPSNDASEDRGIQSVFGSETPCSSTKGWTGHTLGAAGITEAIIALLCLEHGFMPGSLNTQSPDPQLSSNILRDSRHTGVQRVISNSFGFGGSNCSLIFGTAPC